MDTPVSSVERSSSFGVTFGVFVAPLVNDLLVPSVSFGGRPSGGMYIMVSYSFYFVMMDLIVLHSVT